MIVKHYEAKSFEYLLGIPGFSNRLLETHFKLYEGYVKNTNQLSDFFTSIKTPEEYKKPGFSELKRRFGWEFNGMRLHEYYFGNMGKDINLLAPASTLSEKISQDFGSFENWRKEFVAMGSMRGIGWVILAYDSIGNRLFNVWINEHDLGFLAGTELMLVMDVFEHAFMTDYGLEREQYILTFLKAIYWKEVQDRFNIAKQKRERVYV